ncbi:MAG: glycosyltransferase [bacterium]|nr:glycosyltransferase [bacterium]MDT8394983.1 glycosyltransferase [bacterium]
MDPGRVKVLHIISGLGVGGAERLLLWAAKYHDRDKYPIGVVSMMSGGELATEIRDSGVPVVELGQAKGRLTPAGFRNLLSTVASVRPEVIQGHMFHSNLLTRLTKLFVSKDSRVINTVHIEWEPFRRKIAYALTAPLVDGTVTFSPDAGKVFTETGPVGRPIRYIPYGIEVGPRAKKDREGLRTRLGIDLPGPMWITVGRLSRQKAYPDLIEAFAMIKPVQGGPTLLIVGEGEDKPILEKLIQEKGLLHRVRLLGVRHDVPDLLAASDAFVLSSHWEGNPLVVLEAMRASLPIVTTRVGMVPTMTVDGKTAFVVEPNRPDLLASAMEKLMTLGHQARTMGEAGRERLERYYDFRSMQKELELFYSELIRDHGNAGSEEIVDGV